jgi:hypothetical protein
LHFFVGALIVCNAHDPFRLKRLNSTVICRYLIYIRLGIFTSMFELRRRLEEEEKGVDDEEK